MPERVTATADGDLLTVLMPPGLAHLVPVRNHVRMWLAEQGVAVETARDIVTAADEAVTNAVVHRYRPEVAAGSVEVSIRVETVDAGKAAIVLTVSDDGPWQLPAQGAAPDGGFNLPMIRVLADRVDLRHEDGRSTLVARFPHRRSQGFPAL
ncbi:anti-sigma regulatory factor (Ser/Thr protein kinase) [Actinokineospora auranticolor]|uniref:Anti-sigma regulatory factor (Ser/Thr protein kinase) n=2 Tax=Actinokineospora auranticolor TaxID=155976 RepID=A0A2S6GSW8_9PSEU|nr:anti-sigma regulatory factor (Ser/Thr protein kinase) [Actinokineospora auranticolor]